MVEFKKRIFVKNVVIGIMKISGIITGYDQKCDISNQGDVRELRGNKFYLISFVQNAGTSYVYLSKNGKNMRKNIGPLMARFVFKGKYNTK
jgi:hypothetical protein